MKDEKVYFGNAGHIFWDYAPSLTRPMARTVLSLFPNSKVYLIGNGFYNRSEALTANKNLVEETESRSFGGWLSAAFWCGIRRLERFKALLVFFLPNISASSLLRLIKGDNAMVVHGKSMNYVSILILKLFGKKLKLIHWGGKPIPNSRLGKICGYLEMALYDRIFVLMSPEIRYFPDRFRKKISVLPYNSGALEKYHFDVKKWAGRMSQRSILLGNSAWQRDNYKEVLDRLNPEDWDQIVCMLNYGREDDIEGTENFIRKYRAKFGDVFVAWRGVVSYAEYEKIVGQSPIYVCLARYQTGLGAIASAIKQAKAIFLRGDNLEWMRELGVQALDIDTVTDWSFEGLKKYIPDDAKAIGNFTAFQYSYSGKYSVSNWARMIRDDVK